MNIINWWQTLPWEDTKFDQTISPDSSRRKIPLTLKEVFFRDKLAVLSNFVPRLWALQEKGFTIKIIGG